MPSPNPWYGIQGLVTRVDPPAPSPGRLWPEQALTVEQALTAYSLGSARAMGIDDVAGSLEVAKSADFVVLDRDPLTAPADTLIQTASLATYFEGALVHQR